MSCALCTKEKELRDSHIIPGFVFDWLKESSATGYLRHGAAINQRVQDGLTHKLLCNDCEMLFSKFEDQFARRIFKPLHTDENLRLQVGSGFRYEEWLMRFVASIVWRALYYQMHIANPKHLNNEQRQLAIQALSYWREFLLNLRSNPGPFELHMLPMDRIQDHTIESLPPNFNRYLLRTVQFDLIRSKKSAYVVVKMCRLFCFGFIQTHSTERWEGTKLKVRKGEIGGKKISLPGFLLHYLISKANRLAVLEGNISARQLEKISDSYNKAGTRPFTSETLAAGLYDVELFGDPT